MLFLNNQGVEPFEKLVITIWSSNLAKKCCDWSIIRDIRNITGLMNRFDKTYQKKTPEARDAFQINNIGSTRLEEYFEMNNDGIKSGPDPAVIVI